MRSGNSKKMINYFETNSSSAHNEVVGHDPLTTNGQQQEILQHEADATAQPAPEPIETSANTSSQEVSAEAAENVVHEVNSDAALVAEQRRGEMLAGTGVETEPLARTADSTPKWQSLLKRLNAKAERTPAKYLQFGPFTYDNGALTEIVGGRSRRITLSLYDNDRVLRTRIMEAARQSGCIDPDGLPEELEPVQERLDGIWEEINGLRDRCERFGYVITVSHVGLTVAMKREKRGAATTVEAAN